MKKTRGKRTFLKIAVLLVLVLALLLADSRYRLTVSRYTAASSLLPEQFDGFTLVQLSDIHGARFGRDNSRLLEQVAALAPDMIAITGDMVDADTDLSVIDTLLRGLCALAPVYFVTGNHEWASGKLPELEAMLAARGVIYLQNDFLSLERDGQRIVVAGVEDPNGWEDMPSPEELIARVQDDYPDTYTLLLGHRNYWAQRYPALGVDLIVCGHAHGGIVRLPFLGGVLGTGFELFPDWTEGMTRVGRYELVISRGLGNSLPLPRFLNNPEIVAVTLKKAENL